MIRFGIIGYSRIGKRHSAIIEASEEAVLVAVCDPISPIVPEQTNVYTDYREMLANETLDVVCVCSPNGYHAEQSIAALLSGANVICEKPLALNYLDAKKMLEAADATSKHLVCVLQNRYSPQVQWLKEILDENKLGDILQVQVNCFWNRGDGYFKTANGMPHPWHGTLDKDGGPLFTQFSHFIDMLIWLLGDLKVTSGRFANFTHESTIEFEDAGIFTFDLKNGGFGSLHYSIAVWDKNQESSITLIGSEGSIRLGGQYMNALEYCHFNGAVTPDFSNPTTTPIKGNYQGSASNHARVIQNIIDTLNGNATIDFNIADAVHGVEVIEDVYSRR